MAQPKKTDDPEYMKNYRDSHRESFMQYNAKAREKRKAKKHGTNNDETTNEDKIIAEFIKSLEKPKNFPTAETLDKMSENERLDAILEGCRDKFKELYERALALPDDTKDWSIVVELNNWKVLYKTLLIAKDLSS
jgi:hypothetical protein